MAPRLREFFSCSIIRTGTPYFEWVELVLAIVKLKEAGVRGGFLARFFRNSSQPFLSMSTSCCCFCCTVCFRCWTRTNAVLASVCAEAWTSPSDCDLLAETLEFSLKYGNDVVLLGQFFYFHTMNQPLVLPWSSAFFSSTLQHRMSLHTAERMLAVYWILLFFICAFCSFS